MFHALHPFKYQMWASVLYYKTVLQGMYFSRERCCILRNCSILFANDCQIPQPILSKYSSLGFEIDLINLLVKNFYPAQFVNKPLGKSWLNNSCCKTLINLYLIMKGQITKKAFFHHFLHGFKIVSNIKAPQILLFLAW